MKVAAFYQPIKFDIDSRDEIEETISLWQETWKKSGWHPEIVSLDIAKQSPHYSSLTDRSTILYRSTNPVEYTEICYARWLAYQQCGISFWADYDVMNFGFTPEHLDSILSIDNNLDDPIYLSAAGAVGFASSKGFDKIIKTYLDFIDNPPLVLDYPLSQDINDMNIMRALRLNWYDRIAYNDPRFCHDYVNDGWANKHLVHFPYFGTPKPRNSTIRSVIASKQRN